MAHVTTNLTLNKSSKWKIIEQVGEIFPDIGISILSQTFIIETIPEIYEILTSRVKQTLKA